MPYNANGRNACLTGGLRAAITHLSAHSDIPNDAGSLELVGGTYARVAVTWGTAAAGLCANSGALAINIPAGSDYAAIGFWSASTAGNFLGYVLNQSGVGAFGSAAAGTDVVTSAGHGFVNGDRLAVYNVFAESLPAGLAELTSYWVRDVTTDSFKLAATSGGAAIDLTTSGELFAQKFLVEPFVSAGQATIADGALVHDLNGI